jgi:hypothetical protein
MAFVVVHRVALEGPGPGPGPGAALEGEVDGGPRQRRADTTSPEPCPSDEGPGLRGELP